jgi:predicted RNase H-like HicB family nuclease
VFDWHEPCGYDKVSYDHRLSARPSGFVYMSLKIESEREEDGRWLAEVLDLCGALAYGATREEAIARAQVLALRVIADRLEHGEAVPELDSVFSEIA